MATGWQRSRKQMLESMINSADAHPDAKSWSGWSATGEVLGVDGQRLQPRRPLGEDRGR